jgi:3-isopropylmalate dehydrogenase
MKRAQQADAVLFGAVGGPKWADVPYAQRPEAGLLRLRKELGLFANLRPAICYPALADASSLKREVVEGLDIVIVRELTGGVYFGEPKEIVTLENGERRGVDTQVYTTGEIERIARVAFDLAKKRRNKVSSAEKNNVMKTGVLWKQVVTKVHKDEFPEVELEHVLADNCAMQLVRQPKQYDVIVCDNLFGDILSDVAAMLTGSLGMLPSASLGAEDPATGKRKALYEPVHGSAPDIAGRGLANPIAMIGSFAMALRYSFGLGEAADRLERAITDALAGGRAHQGHRRAGRQRRRDALRWAMRSCGSSSGARDARSSVADRPERIAGADEGAVGDRIRQHARAEALAHAEIGRQVEVRHGLAVAARRIVHRADRHDVAGVEIAARAHVEDQHLAVAPQRAGLGLGRDGREGGKAERGEGGETAHRKPHGERPSCPGHVSAPRPGMKGTAASKVPERLSPPPSRRSGGFALHLARARRTALAAPALRLREDGA